MQYPEPGKLYYEKMGRYWRGITKDKIPGEISLIEQYLSQQGIDMKAS
jgi:hypothetical protein